MSGERAEKSWQENCTYTADLPPLVASFRLSCAVKIVGTMAAHEFAAAGEYPERVDFRKTLAGNPLPSITSGTPMSSASGDELTQQALSVVDALNAALVADDAEALERCFSPEQAYWRDQVALTWHMRTFRSPGVVAANLLATWKARGIPEGFRLEGTPLVIPVSPTLQWVDCSLSFRTASPAASASGRLLLLPHTGSGTMQWKVWILSTWLVSLDLQHEDESLLQSPARQLRGLPRIETEVLIIGGGNAGACLAARLKALAVDSIVLERNERLGDNWALRYDSLRFHIPTSMCEMPYIEYPKELQTPNRLSRDGLAAQLRRFISAFGLNIITSAHIRSTVYDPSAERWEVTFTIGPNSGNSPPKAIVVVARHLVQATGVASQKPYSPSLPDANLYRGRSLHSASYSNPSASLPAGAKSVVVVGAANTAFDVASDLASSPSLPAITMVVRSPTYIIPESYVFDPHGFGAYDALPLAVADRALCTLPTVVDAHLAGSLFAALAAQEPERYAALAAAGFPVRDSTHPDENIVCNLLERGGGHYVDIGGARVLEERRAAVKVGEPERWTARGLRFTDGSEVEADIVIWCTGFEDKNVRAVVEGILGGEGEGGETTTRPPAGLLLGPREIAERVDATWGLDEEGEIRGMWKRHLGMKNYWVMGGHTAHHRWYSRLLAMQIKAGLAGILPPAYRDTAGV
ncbi:hypothetical protein V8F06_001981 [Rhypophila decipiens]